VKPTQYILLEKISQMLISLIIAACAFPLISKRFPRLRIPPSFLFFARHFGTGVLVATAFVHLLPTAFINLTNSCLPPFWNQKYPAMAGAISMCAVFLVTIVEMVFTKGLCKENYSEDDHRNAVLESGLSTTERLKNILESDRGEVDHGISSHGSFATSEHIGGRGGMGTIGFGLAGKRRSRSHSVGIGLQRFSSEMSARSAHGEPLKPTTEPTRPTTPSQPTSIPPSLAPANDAIMAADSNEGQSRTNLSTTASNSSTPENNPQGFEEEPHEKITTLTTKQIHKKAMLQVFLLEMGILFHSVFIGMALSVTVGSSFIVLLVAITFHQTFEGLALGARIAGLKWRPGALQPWLMALAYGLTTPIGQAIGLATHTLYLPDSQTGLLMVGIMNAISSGLLVFAGLVELLAEDFLSDESWNTLSGRQRIHACLFVLSGAFGMALVGAWA
jgi:zinc transporter 1/2/3